MEIKVRILDKNTLELLEDAKKGDLINLDNIDSINNELITSKIEKVFLDRLNKEVEETRKNTLLEVDNKIKESENNILLLKKDNEIIIKDLKENNEKEFINIKNEYEKIIQNLNNEINNIKNETTSKLKEEFIVEKWQ